MEHFHIVEYSIYIAAFLLGTTLLKMFSQKISLPYTVAVLTVGFLAQFINYFFHLGFNIALSPDFIFFILLPLLLFESAMRINIHQFKLQFKTIAFLATFCLMLSVFLVAVGVSVLIGLPFNIALLFGAIISATDPIAVLALFKTLGAPKRLSLVAEGESMFNDATGVIAFRLVSGFVFGTTMLSSQTIFQTIGNFAYVFIGSVIIGVLFGYFSAALLRRVRTDQILISATITGLSLGSFAIAEHFFHLSGVITTVISGLIFGNLARGRMKSKVTNFLEEYFEYLGFVAISLVFFLASYTLDLGLFTRELPVLLLVILIVLVARAISVYISVYLTNVLPLFKNEPNIPMSWQHILNWGGLRGVIPLVLVYSLPDSFIYKELMLQFTLATLVFTLFFNALTVRKLLTMLKLHVPTKEEIIIQDEMKIFSIEEAEKKLHNLPYHEFTQSVISSADDKLFYEENKYRRHLLSLSSSKEFVNSVKIQALEIERKTLRNLFEQGRVNEGVLYEFESELDLQQDMLEYPSIHTSRAVNKKGQVITKKPFRKRLASLRHFISRNKLLSKLTHISEENVILDRYALLRARLITSQAVIEYISRIEEIFHGNKKVSKAIIGAKKIQERYVKKNQKEIQQLSTEYSNIIIPYQQKIVAQLIS